ncbi:hypothetical protein GCM10009605_41860 [Nocardiopsis composta]
MVVKLDRASFWFTCGSPAFSETARPFSSKNRSDYGMWPLKATGPPVPGPEWETGFRGRRRAPTGLHRPPDGSHPCHDLPYAALGSLSGMNPLRQGPLGELDARAVGRL